MKISKATVTILQDGGETTLEFPSMPLQDLAHKLLERCHTDYLIGVTDLQKRIFEQEAKSDYMKARTFTDFEAYQDLYVRMKIDSYLRLEHAKKAYHELVFNQKPAY